VKFLKGSVQFEDEREKKKKKIQSTPNQQGLQYKHHLERGITEKNQKIPWKIFFNYILKSNHNRTSK
jgi:hypothetical protein